MTYVANKFFVNPFAVAGDVQTIPETVQPSGAVSYPQGFTSKYDLDPIVDPSALNVPRLETNQALLDVTTSLKQYQVNGTPNFITTSDNLGTPFVYTKGSRALYNPGSGLKPYISLADSNTDLPSVQTKWVYDDLNIQTMRTSEYVTYVSTGTPNALVVNPTITYPTLIPGTSITVIANATNTAASTLSVNAFGAIDINVGTPTGLGPLSGGEMIDDGIYDFDYNGTVWILKNPTLSTSLYGASVYTDTNIPVTGANTPVKFTANQTNWDTNGLWDNINKRFIVGKSGFFDLNLNILMGGAGSTIAYPVIYKSGSPAFRLSEITSTGDICVVGTVKDFASSPTDYYELFLLSNGSARTVIAGSGQRFQITFSGK